MITVTLSSSINRHAQLSGLFGSDRHIRNTKRGILRTNQEKVELLMDCGNVIFPLMRLHLEQFNGQHLT